MIELSKTTFDKKRPHAVPVHYFGDLASIARANADVLAKLQEVGKTNGYEDIFIIATSSTGFLSVIVSAVKNGRIFIAESDSAIAVDKMTNGFVASTVIDT